MISNNKIIVKILSSDDLKSYLLNNNSIKNSFLWGKSNSDYSLDHKLCDEDIKISVNEEFNNKQDSKIFKIGGNSVDRFFKESHNFLVFALVLKLGYIEQSKIDEYGLNIKEGDIVYFDTNDALFLHTSYGLSQKVCFLDLKSIFGVLD